MSGGSAHDRPGVWNADSWHSWWPLRVLLPELAVSLQLQHTKRMCRRTLHYSCSLVSYSQRGTLYLLRSRSSGAGYDIGRQDVS
jgi:hypothetical protein